MMGLETNPFLLGFGKLSGGELSNFGWVLEGSFQLGMVIASTRRPGVVGPLPNGRFMAEKNEGY